MGSRVTVCCAACGLTQEPAVACLRCQAVLPVVEGAGSVAPSSGTARVDLPVGAVIGGIYEIVRSIGAGGMGAVYLAKDRSLGRNVALKVMPRALLDDPELVERFRREARSAATLDHPNIIPIHVVGDHEGRPYFVMKFIDGESLSDVVARSGFIPLDRASRIIEGVLDGLQVIHDAGFVHRDIKLANIMLDRRGVPIILDFGILRDAQATNLTKSGLIPGTPQYMAPEQAKGIVAIDGRADIYSVGVVLYELLTGAPPFSGNSGIEVLMKHVGEAPDPPSRRNARLPAEVDAIVLRALAKSPGERFLTSSDFRDALAGLRARLVAERAKATDVNATGDPGMGGSVAARGGGVSGVGATAVATSTSSVRATGVSGEAMTRARSRKARVFALVAVVGAVVGVVAVVALQKSGGRGGDGAGAVAGGGREDSPRRHGVTEEKEEDRRAGAGASTSTGATTRTAGMGADAGMVAPVRVEARRAIEAVGKAPEARPRRVPARKGRVSIIVFDGDEPVDSAAVFVDGKRIVGRKDVAFDVGKHEFTATAPGLGGGRVVKRIEAGRNSDVEIHLKR